MTSPPLPEVWLRGPVEGYAPALLPIVHALLQVQEDFARLKTAVPTEHVWERPGGAASIGFHIRHTGGALDRLFTYARGEMLSDAQKTALAQEDVPGVPAPSVADLVDAATQTIDHALEQVRGTAVETLLDARFIGRARLPSTVMGLLFHAAEHSTRHAGQAITTARILAGA